jgi:hypothetical protein
MIGVATKAHLALRVRAIWAIAVRALGDDGMLECKMLGLCLGCQRTFLPSMHLRHPGERTGHPRGTWNRREHMRSSGQERTEEGGNDGPLSRTLVYGILYGVPLTLDSVKTDVPDRPSISCHRHHDARSSSRS